MSDGQLDSTDGHKNADETARIGIDTRSVGDDSISGNDDGDVDSENFLMLDDPESNEASQDMTGETSETTFSSEFMKDVYWHGSVIKIYPLDYQKVTLIKLQLAACFTIFLVFGMNDQATGSLMPSLTDHYKVSKEVVSRIFISQMTGYTLASFSNHKIHVLLGQRGAFLLGASIAMIFQGVLALKPSSFNIYILSYFPVGFALGILDALCNVLIGSLEVNNNELLGALHGIYGVAAMSTAPIVTYISINHSWNLFFYLPIALALVSIVIAIPAFRYETPAKYIYSTSISDQEENDTSGTSNFNDRSTEMVDGSYDSSLLTGSASSSLEYLRNPMIILYSVFLFLYLGAEISTASWLYTYLLETKAYERFRMSFVTSCFWSGLTVGRFILSFFTKKYFKNAYRANMHYASLTLVLFTCFVLLGLINSSSLLYSIVIGSVIFATGVFFGPLFPNASLVALQVLPKSLHISGVGTAIALGGCGAAILPYLVGLGINGLGIAFMPLLCWLLVCLQTLVWDLYPSFIKNQEDNL
ncbi:hypothetical protein TPHA_0P01500 [Tetrapisispora phaffii CBS 4417]|uniref:Major facilitator superfamily (MFS) profile domain-containing protein n=1 Tax=Tetrapisispora phaffii (strain ATCC 24235 / CBS 4417 / NBRC 1672 / NRRL Y-8282 / UCD 70-5) TaxID=1071381 RepID=G8C2D0_TETPH|nr:hypothetical protein TPHA_0P01500 [Tetrapisispora phaffii CBS 4417]CCE66308.1 hypothetical protein TPHA_0P01500 [Tetrapisispora phaffii CBS 4417]